MKIIDYKQQDYLTTWQAMQNFTDNRTANTSDEIWLVEHPPVFTLGQAGKAEHIIDAGDIPVVNTDRGGQVTYHAPGQMVAYVLMDLRRTPYTIRQLVDCLEEAIVRMLNDYSIFARRRSDAPGVYVGSDKICSLGLRVRKGCSYHGLALNVDMDLAPFKRINPCGYEDLVMTQMATYLPSVDYAEIKRDLGVYLREQLIPEMVSA